LREIDFLGAVVSDAIGERVRSGLSDTGWGVGSIFRSFFLGGSRSEVGAAGVLAAAGFVFLYSAKSDEAFSLSGSTDFRGTPDFFGIDNCVFVAGLVSFSSCFFLTFFTSSLFSFVC
jgi:hypothetical protein